MKVTAASSLCYRDIVHQFRRPAQLRIQRGWPWCEWIAEALQLGHTYLGDDVHEFGAVVPDYPDMNVHNPSWWMELADALGAVNKQLLLNENEIRLEPVPGLFWEVYVQDLVVACTLRNEGHCRVASQFYPFDYC